MPSYAYSNICSLPRNDSQFPLIDLRSDTVSKPTPEMRQAMFEAVVGDDVYDEDATVNLLQERVAKLFQKEAALFVTTGTMGNNIAVLAHCDRRGMEIIVGDKCHIVLYEQGAAAQTGGVSTRTVPTLPNGTFDLTVLQDAIRSPSVHTPITGLIAVENTHNGTGGRVLSMAYLKEVVAIAKKHKIPLHMDGARIFNASVHLGIPVSEITEGFDSVQFCFSKGLGAPIGSMLVGSHEFIHKAKRLRKAMGAAMRQVGVIAAPCLVALDTMVDRLAEDHRRLKMLAQGIADLLTDTVRVDLGAVQTNILMVQLRNITPDDFCNRLRQVTKEEEKALENDCVVCVVRPSGKASVRFVTYWEITDQDINRVLRKIKFIDSEVKKNIASA